MAARSLLDLAITEEGDLQLGPNGDLLLYRDADVVAQDVMWRLKTYPGDWTLQPQCGAGLEDFIGSAMTQSTMGRVESRVLAALTHDGFLSSELQAIEALPLGGDDVIVRIDLRYNQESFSLLFSLDLKEGVLSYV